MTTNGLQYGLNIRAKPNKPLGPPKSKAPPPGFAPDNDSDSEEDQAAGGVFSKIGKQKSTVKSKKRGSDRSTVNAQLANFNELSEKAAQSAEAAAAEVDPSIYDYDASWEDMQQLARSKKKADERDAVERKPKYMENLLVAAEVRKRDQLRAKERMLQKEREAEGDEFVDKESFVTEAYKKQQEEVKRLEEEERLREENLRKKSQGMSSFYRNMLNNTESKHDEMVMAAESKDRRPLEKDDEIGEEQDLEADLARIAREKGTAIETNEEGQVVDKTQLLTGGLNVASKRKPEVGGRPAASMRERGPQWRSNQQKDVRARQSKMLEEQLAQSQKRALEEDSRSKEELEIQSKSRKTEGDVKSARERYLQRKAAAGKT